MAEEKTNRESKKKKIKRILIFVGLFILLILYLNLDYFQVKKYIKDQNLSVKSIETMRSHVLFDPISIEGRELTYVNASAFYYAKQNGFDPDGFAGKKVKVFVVKIDATAFDAYFQEHPVQGGEDCYFFNHVELDLYLAYYHHKLVFAGLRPGFSYPMISVFLPMDAGVEEICEEIRKSWEDRGNPHEYYPFLDDWKDYTWRQN
ncbi:hypothetical protein [Akkermansia muciniphila]|uniref:hypothetical protein n=1 Tax=Akkermansia muciniphila TaxID=239935 RepID=UPI00122F0BE3|nr:hypothetical protein [Akkermansia muciniphila]KAA3387615.1 hypothetical protein F1912_11730 [Akkermansia muciniphila]